MWLGVSSSCLRARSFELGDQPPSCSLFDSDTALFALPATPTGAFAFANPSPFELDCAGECATAMASLGDPHMAHGSNQPMMHYWLIVCAGLITLKKPSKHIGNLLDFKEALCLSKFSLCDAFVVEDWRNPTEKEMGYLYFPSDF